MAKYTIELREIVSTFGKDEVEKWFSSYELSDFLTPEQIKVIEDRNVWNKAQLARRILTHFYTREICTDAIGQWMNFIEDKMNEIMETYAPIIYTASINFDPLVNVDFTESYTGNTTGKNSSNSTSLGSGLTVNSDTPQGEIDKNKILSGSFASSTGANETNNTIADTSNSSGSETYTKTTRGNSGVSATAQKMIQQTRDIIRAVNTEIVYELEPLFMGLY